MTRLGANAPWLLVLICAALLAPAGCHSGAEHGLGTPCDDSHPCRGGLVCVGTCQPAPDAGRPDVPTDVPTDVPIDVPTDVPTDVSTDVPTDVPTDVADASASDTTTEVEPDLPDAAPDSADGADGGSVLLSPYPPRPCDRTRPFERLRSLAGLQSVPGTGDQTASLSPDELTLTFSSSRLGRLQEAIYTATRTTRDGVFSRPLASNTLKGSFTNQGPRLTANQLTIYFDSNRQGYGWIYRADRAAPGDDWNPPAQVLTISAPGAMISDGGPFISGDGRVLYFHTTRSGQLDIFRAETIDEKGNFGPSFPVTGINTGDQEARPVVSSDELTIYYASSRPDGGALGGWDIWMSTRASKDDDFGDAVNLVELNTSGYDTPNWVSADQCELYFSRDTSQGSRLFAASRPLLPPDAGADGL